MASCVPPDAWGTRRSELIPASCPWATKSLNSRRGRATCPRRASRSRASLLVGGRPLTPHVWIRAGPVPSVCSDRRPYMRAAYALFAGECDGEELARQMEASSKVMKRSINQQDKAKAVAPYFYANLYLGLYAEAKGDPTLSRQCESTRRGRSRSQRRDGSPGARMLASIPLS